MATSREPKTVAAPSTYRDAISDLDAPQHNATDICTDLIDRSMSGAVYRLRAVVSGSDQISVQDALTLAWADREERTRIIEFSIREARQTMNLRTRKGAEVVV